MSRSYRKTAVNKLKGKPRTPRRYRAKTCANRKVRISEICGGKAAYKRVYDSWDICDIRMLGMRYGEGSKAALRRKWESGDEYLRRRYRTFNEALRAWKRSYTMK